MLILADPCSFLHRNSNQPKFLERKAKISPTLEIVEISEISRNFDEILNHDWTYWPSLPSPRLEQLMSTSTSCFPNAASLQRPDGRSAPGETAVGCVWACEPRKPPSSLADRYWLWLCGGHCRRSDGDLGVEVTTSSHTGLGIDVMEWFHNW